MPTQILMPALSPTMTEGKLAKWLKKEGDQVKPGDVLAEIETDKATMEVEAVDEGTIGKLLVAEGAENVAVNTPIAVLLGEGEDAKSIGSGTATAPKPAPAPAPVPAATPSAPAVAASKPIAAPAPAAAPRGNGQDRVFASPLAKRMAQQAGIDLAALRGTGPHGRIVRADVESALSGAAPRAPAAPPAAPAAKPAPAPVLEVPGLPPYTQVAHTTMRKVIARRLTEAKLQQPHFYMSVECELDALLKVRQELNAKAPEKGGYKLSVNDFIIRAAGLALKRVPAANAAWHDEGVRLYKRADISVAVAIPNGLITPVIHGADQKGLVEISNEMKELAQKARDGKLKPEEYQGGTF